MQVQKENAHVWPKVLAIVMHINKTYSQNMQVYVGFDQVCVGYIHLLCDIIDSVECKLEHGGSRTCRMAVTEDHKLSKTDGILLEFY